MSQESSPANNHNLKNYKIESTGFKLKSICSKDPLSSQVCLVQLRIESPCPKMITENFMNLTLNKLLSAGIRPRPKQFKSSNVHVLR